MKVFLLLGLATAQLNNGSVKDFEALNNIAPYPIRYNETMTPTNTT